MLEFESGRLFDIYVGASSKNVLTSSTESCRLPVLKEMSINSVVSLLLATVEEDISVR